MQVEFAGGNSMKAINIMALAAAAGISCARELPVYMQREIAHETQGEGITYKYVWSNATQLRISMISEKAIGSEVNVVQEYGSLHTERTDVTKEYMRLSYARLEPEDSAACMEEEVRLSLEFWPNNYERDDYIEVAISDYGCDGIIDYCSALRRDHSSGVIADISAGLFCNAKEDTFIWWKLILNSDGDIDEQIRLWHERKGL